MDRVKNIFFRYFLIILVALPNLFLFYFIFTPLTIYPLLFLFNLFFENVLLLNNTFYFTGNYFIEIIGACVAGSAYYLLFILNVSVPKINFKKRLKMILFSFTFLLILNIIRIFILGSMYLSDSIYFDITHKIFWYLGTTLFVVLIWFLEVKIFKIKEVPFYSDVRFLIKKFKK